MAHELNEDTTGPKLNEDTTTLEPSMGSETVEFHKDTTTKASWEALGISDLQPFRMLNPA